MGTKHLIIGAGKAALSAAEEIRRVAPDDELRLVSMEDCAPYSPASLVYLLSGRITEDGLWIKDGDYFRNLRGTLVTGKEVVGVLPERRWVLYQDGSSENYDNLLIASGSKAIKPPIEGLEEIGTHDFKTLSDCRRLLMELRGKQNVAILGAGMTGMHIGAALLERGCRVNIIEREENLLPQHFNEEAVVYIRDAFVDHQVRFFTGKMVKSVNRKNGKIRIALSDDTSLDVDILINAAGVTGRASFLEGTGVSVGNGVWVDGRMWAGVDHIYAAGDVAEAPDYFTGRPRMNGIIPSAVRQGRVAGSNMAGVAAEYEGGIPMAAFNFMGNQAFSIGQSMLQGSAVKVLKQKDDGKRQFKKLVFDGNRLIGGMFLNAKIDPGLILYLIREGVDLASYKEALFEGTKPLSNPWLSSLKFHSNAR
jgi:phenylglyoxylate dehydrogenase epsilon subunit